MPSLFKQAKAQRRELLRRDAELARRVAESFGVRYRSIRVVAGELSAEMAAARARAEVIDLAWLARSWRFRYLLALTKAEVHNFSAEAAGLITRARAEAFARAAADTRELLAQAGAAQFTSPGLAELAQGLADPTRLRSVLEPIADGAVVRVRQAVTFNLLQEQTAAALERSVTEGLGTQLTHALSVTRTAHMNAYREGARAARLAERENVYGWVWVAELSTTTCVLCWAMHGTVHDVTEPLDTHWNCRCQAVPLVLGADEAIETGADMFEQLSAEDKREVLGAAGYEAYKAGRVGLKDFVGVHRTKEFGRMRYVRSLKQVLG
jgi:hypothetical protein